MIKNFKSKSIEVEAIQYKGNNITEIHDFVKRHLTRNLDGVLIISSVSNEHLKINIDDYIIKINNQEICSCNETIFNLLYQEIDDKSKLESPEVEIFCEYTPKLAGSTYGSDEYKEFLKEMQVALNHHYSENRHYPEHFRNGIQGMTLIDIMELLADWKSATLRHNDGDLIRSINFNQERFTYDNDIKQILLNTAKLLYTYRIEFGCCDGRDGVYLSDTIEGIHNKIDEDEQLNDDEKRILKLGYCHEYKDKDYYDGHMCIDNGFDCYWYKQSYFK